MTETNSMVSVSGALKITSAALCKKSLVHFKCEKDKLQWKILWLWKVWGLPYFKPISRMKKHFKKENVHI
jgi:hypothetical protein